MLRALFILALGVLHGCAIPGGAETGGGAELIVLGVAQDGGVPHLGCEKPCCAQARRDGIRLHPACLAIHDRSSGRLVLIEATPRIEEQVATLHALTKTHGRGRKVVDAIVLTHAHIGHYLGLAQLGREVASAPGIELHASPRMVSFLETNGPWDQLVRLGQVLPTRFTAGRPFEVAPGVTITALAVPHRDEYSDTAALRIEGPEKTVLFVPDIDHWGEDAATLSTLLRDVDVAFLDGTFYDGRELPGRDLDEIPHPAIVTTMSLLEEHARARPGVIRFIHLNHTNPALFDRGIRQSIEAAGFSIASRGDRIEL